MNFARTLIGTMLVAVFGAIIFGGAPVGAAAGHDRPGFLSAASTRLSAYVFVLPAPSRKLAVAFCAVILLEEKPLAATRARRGASSADVLFVGRPHVHPA